MSINPNYVPWFSLLGVIGAGIGYLLSEEKGGQGAVVPAMVGLVVGVGIGVAVRIYLKIQSVRAQQKVDPAPSSEQETESKEPGKV
jgi:hypothetical protein